MELLGIEAAADHPPSSFHQRSFRPASLSSVSQHPGTRKEPFPFELGIKLERERLRLEPRERWGEPALVVWPTTGARPPVEGGADGPAQQEAFRLGGSGQP
jgi:hypothetical protein